MKLLAVIALLSLTGCIGSMVPMTKIQGTLSGQPFTLQIPKDLDLEGLELLTQTNGTVTAKITKLRSRMNPEIISTTGDAQAKLISTAVAAGAAVAGQAAGAAAK